MKFIIRFSRLILICLVFIPINSCAISGDPSEDSLALDKSIRIGHLPNGFTYYLKPTSDTDKISLQFYVKVGRFNERLWDTNEYSHLMEHFGYIEGYLKSYYSQNDATFKESGNTTFALTARMYTPYWSSVNSIDTVSLKDRLEWFYNISNIDLEDSVVLREARCVRQETFYKGQGFELNRFFNKSIRDAAILFNSNGDTPYTDWIKAYDMGGISVSSLREFYRHWYRPDRMGLVVTGNIRDMDNLEQQLIALYGKIPKVNTKNDDFDMRFFYLNSPPRFKTVERVELSQFFNWNKNHSQISLFFRVKKFHKTIDTKEKWLNEQLYKAMFAMTYLRLRKKGMLSWSPKKGDVVDAVFPDRDFPYFRMPAIESKPDTERNNIQRVSSTLQQLWENGFTQQEWNKQKQVMLNQICSKDTSNIMYWEEQLKNHFVYGEILPIHKKAITKQWIESLNLEDINSYLNENFSVMPDDIYITASAGHPALSFTENEIRGWINEAIKHPVGLTETIDITTLIPVGEKNSPLMSPNEVKNLKEVGYRKKGIDPDNGLEVLELDNGVKLMLDWQEPNGNVSESISINGTSPRGASCFSKNDYYAAVSAADIVKLSGVVGFNRNLIQNKLGGEFRPGDEPVQLHIKNNNSTVSARANLENLEKYLQLIYLYFTSPQSDSTAFKQWKSQIIDQYFGKIYGGVSPRIDMKNAIAKLFNFRDFAPSNQISTEQFYQKQNVKLKKAMECYQTIFGNASDFTFVVKGRYEKERILPLLQKYLGNLPSDNNANCSVINDINRMDILLPKGPIYHPFYANEMKAGYKLYTAPYMLSFIVPIPENKWKDRVTMDIISIHLGPKFKQELRFIKGKSVYYETVEGNYAKEDSLYSLTIFVDALDDELQWVRKEIKAMIVDIKDHGIAMNEKDIVLEDPLFFGRYTSTPKLKEKIMKYARSLTSEKIKKVATKYLNEIHQYEFVLMERKKDFVIP